MRLVLWKYLIMDFCFFDKKEKIGEMLNKIYGL